MILRLPLDLPGVDKDDYATWPDVRFCDAQHHSVPVLATRLCHWVTGPVEFCDPCADRMLTVAAVLGTHVHEAPIDQSHLRPVPRRAVAVGGKLEPD